MKARKQKRTFAAGIYADIYALLTEQQKQIKESKTAYADAFVLPIYAEFFFLAKRNLNVGINDNINVSINACSKYYFFISVLSLPLLYPLHNAITVTIDFFKKTFL